MAKTVTVIPATITPQMRPNTASSKKRRVAGYARVSTDKDEQFTSYEAQVDYYTRFICSHDEWQFVKVYTDEGISGLDTKNRDGFNEMVTDALAGKIDLIVTKSISRFARNTVHSLVTVRNLKAAGCECFFEKENIWTFDSKGELMLTILSSLAQEESRSISENVTWGQRKRFADGKVSLPYKHFLGYEKGPDGQPKIVEKEAEIVRRIYSEFMLGKTVGAIARNLTRDGIPTPAGKEKWKDTTVESILTNEKYKGAAILQKRFTVDYLTKRMKLNEGEVPQYYVEQSHDAIVSPEEWEAVQAEFNRRRGMGKNYSGRSIFTSHIVCGECGSFFGTKIWHSNSKYRTVIMQCNRKFDNQPPCQTPHLREEDVKCRFLDAWNSLAEHRDEKIEHCRIFRDELTNTLALDAQISEVQKTMDEIVAVTRQWIEGNAKMAMDQDTYKAQYDEYVRAYDAVAEKMKKLQAERQARLEQAEALDGYLITLIKQESPCLQFDDFLFKTAVDRITVCTDGSLLFRFKDGTEVSA